MTTEGNPIPAPTSSLIQTSGQTLTIIVTTVISVAALGVAIISNQNTQLESVRQLIQASDSDRQADTRAINSRVDAAEQLMVATSPYLMGPVVIPES